MEEPGALWIRRELLSGPKDAISLKNSLRALLLKTSNESLPGGPVKTAIIVLSQSKVIDCEGVQGD